MLRRDLWHQEIKHPCKMGCDLVGRVVNVGDKCDDIKIGDRVCAVGLAIGGNAKYAILPSSRAFCCPEDIHPTKVACLVRTYMAAYQSLHRAGGVKIRPGNKVLIIGGAGALGQALIQLSIAAGADEVYATGKGSNSKRIIENLGAQSLGRKPGEWLPYVKGEMDIVIDSVCGDYFVSSHRALKRNGKLVCVGSTAIAKKADNWNSGLEHKKRFSVVKMASALSNTSFYDVFSSLEMKRDIFRKDLFRLFHLCRNLDITPKVAFCVSLNEVANSHLDLEAGGIDGSIICLPWGCEGRKLGTIETEQDLITEYEDGIEVRESVIGGQIKPLFGKVMKDGTFRILSKDRNVFNEYDDDLYSRAGDAHRPSTQGGLRRVDSTPFGFQDDMDKSYRRGMLNEDNEEDSRMSSHNTRHKKHSSHADDNYSRPGRQPVLRTSTRSNSREEKDDPDDYINEKKDSSRRRDAYGDEDDDARIVRSSSRRGSSRNTGSSRNVMVNDNDDARSVRSSSRRGSSRNTGSRRNVMVDDHDDAHSVRSSSRRGSSRNTGSRRNVMVDDHDDARSVRSSSRRGSSRNTGSRRNVMVDDHDDARSVRSSSRRGNSRNASSRRNVMVDGNDDARSVRSRYNGRGDSSRNEGTTRRHGVKDDKGDHSVLSKSRVRASIIKTGGRRNSTVTNDDDVDNGQIRPSRSREGDAPDDYSLKRTPSILRNRNNNSTGPQSRGTSPRHESSRSSRMKSSSRGGSSRPVASSARGVQQPVPRARSMSRDPDASRSLERGRTRSRSIDSKLRDDRSPSLESVYSAYSNDNYSAAPSVATRESEYTPPQIHEKEKKRKDVKVKQKKAVEKTSSKKGFFSRLRSKSRSKSIQRAAKAELKFSVSTKANRSSSKIPPPAMASRKARLLDEKGEREDRRTINNPPAKEKHAKRSSSKRRESNRRENGKDREKDHRRDDYSDEASNDYYEEEEVRSVVLLKGASEGTMSEDDDEYLRGSNRIATRDPINIARKDRSGGGSRRATSKRSSSLRSSRGGTQRSSSRAHR